MRQSVLAVPAAVAVIAGLFLSSEYGGPVRTSRTPRGSTELVAPSDDVIAIARRTRAKCLLARRVIDQRLPLLEAAEMFRQVNGEDGTAALDRVGIGRSAREKQCRQVIAFVEGAECEGGGQVSAGTPAGAALRAELDRLLAAGEFPPDTAAE